MIRRPRFFVAMMNSNSHWLQKDVLEVPLLTETNSYHDNWSHHRSQAETSLLITDLACGADSHNMNG
jgi:hypothetical protein